MMMNSRTQVTMIVAIYS